MKLIGSIVVIILLLHIASSCVSPQGFKRPEILDCTIFNDQGTQICFFKGIETTREPKDSVGMRCTDIDSENALLDYLDSIEIRLKKCLINRKQCK